jgi:uncharacterized protein involved in response to NO
MTIDQTRRATTAKVAREDRAFPWYIGAALAVALAGGFVRALLLPLAEVFNWDWGMRWRALAQVHGHVQVGGWLGLFIAGMALRLAPRFAGRPLALAATTPAALALLVVRLIGRTVAQPWLDVPGTRALLIVGVAAELAGSALVGAALVGTLLPAARTLPSAPRLLLGAVGMVAQAGLTALCLLALNADALAVPPDRDGLLTVQFYAFLLPFALGVSLRAFPTFFDRPRISITWAWLIAGGLLMGTVPYAGARPLGSSAAAVRAEQAGALLIAVTIAVAIAQLGVWRAPVGLRPAARPLVLLFRTAYVWLGLAALWLGVAAVHALSSGAPVAPAQAHGVRHMLALGVFTTLLFGMAQLMLPWLAMRRASATRLRREAWVLWMQLTSATALRALGAVLELRGAGTERYVLIAVAGILGIAALLFFAVTIVRAAHFRAPEIPLSVRER